MFRLEKSQKKNRNKWTLLFLCLITTLSLIPLSQMVFAAPSTTVPVIQDALLNDTTKPVVLINNSTPAQTGYSTLADAMTAIGSNNGDYTLVFVQDYDMVPSTDMNATQANATGANVSLAITSTFISDAPFSVQQTKTFSMKGSNTSGYNFYFNADTTIYNCVFDVYGASCSHMFGNGHNFTIGDNVVVNNKGSNGRIQLYGGGDSALGTTTNPATTNLVINSGTFAYAMAGNRNGVFTGNAKITVQGTATVTNLYAASQGSAFGANSTSEIIADGTNGAAFSTIAANFAATLPASTSIKLTLKNAKDFGVVDLNSKNDGTSEVFVLGNDNHIHTRLLAGSMKIDTGATLRLGSDSTGANAGTTASYGGALTLKGDLTLGENATYIHAGISAQSIGGDLIIDGDGAEIQLYKKDAATAPVPMTITGSYSNPAHLLKLSLWKNVAAKDQDTLLTFSNTINADSGNYVTRFFSTSANALFKVEKSGKNIICSLEYTYPSYYKVSSIPDLYSYTEVGNSTNTDGGSRTVYRKYIYNNTSNVWELFDTDANGVPSGLPIEQDKEHPQPDNEYLSNFVSSKGTMVRFDEFGKYIITAAVGTNASGLSATSTGTACGNHSSFFDYNNMGASNVNAASPYDPNASWADLKQTNSDCSIYKAYLVMTTSMRGNAGSLEETVKSNLINNPMQLMYGSDIMLSNGYLPEGFKIGKSGANDVALNADTPTLLYDYRGVNATFLGEAMTITDVTDFVKAHGYGRYYGMNIPCEGTDVDATIAWRLIVLEEDESLEYVRKVSLQLGPISNGNLEDGKPATLILDLDGLTTPDALGGETFGGQLLIIGSDNTTDSRVGGGTGSNLHNTFYPNPEETDPSKVIAIPIASNDPSTPDVDRPIVVTSDGKEIPHWSQGLIDINGVRLTASDVCRIEENGAMGIDMSLLTLTNEENLSWETLGGHNLYLTPSSPSIMMTSRNDGTQIGYIDTLGLSTAISLPKFSTDIWHTDICTVPAVGTDIVAGQPVIVYGTAENITPNISAVQGSFNTHVVVNIDKKLTNIRDISATFHNYDPITQATEDIPTPTLLFVYDAEAHTITFDFGTEFLNIPLYNTLKDSFEFNFMADTPEEPTINDTDVRFLNTIGVWGQTIYQNNEVIQTPYACYVFDEDIFNTYLNQVQIAKILTGDFADPNQEFTFTVLIKNVVGGHYAEGTKINYTGGVLDGFSAEKPADGTLIVNSNGEITFKLKHGQYVNFTDVLGSIEVTEASSSGCKMSWENVLIKEDGEEKSQHVGNDFKTGSVAIGENETRKINIYNDKSMVPPTGINLSDVRPYLFVVTFSVGGCIMLYLGYRRRKKLYL